MTATSWQVTKDLLMFYHCVLAALFHYKKGWQDYSVKTYLDEHFPELIKVFGSLHLLAGLSCPPYFFVLSYNQTFYKLNQLLGV